MAVHLLYASNNMRNPNASNNMSNPNICCVENLGTSNYFKRICIYQSNGRCFIQTTILYWKGEFGHAEVYLNYFGPSLKCIYSKKSRPFILFYNNNKKKLHAVFFNIF